MATQRIIHVARDEKFINAAIYQFEKVAPDRNIFFILLNNVEKPLKYVNKQPFVKIAENSEEGKKQLVAEVTETDVVIFHSLSQRFYDIVLSLPAKTKTVWFCFGYEIYNDKRYFKQRSIYAPHTIKRFYDAKGRPFDQQIKDSLKPFLRNFNKNIPLTSSEKKIKAIKRIDYLCSSFREEFDVICKKIGQDKQFFNFWYYPLEQIVDVNASFTEKKKVILVGNSGYSTGNHLDVFQALKTKELYNFTQIVVPLSYGDQSYSDAIRSLGKQYLGEKFHPLTAFMPLGEYNEVLSKAGIAIFYNMRQQALGNIIALLWMGSKIYLSKQNAIYQFLKRNRVVIYAFEEEFMLPGSLDLLRLDQVENNRKILYELLNEENLLHLLKRQLEPMLKSSITLD